MAGGWLGRKEWEGLVSTIPTMSATETSGRKQAPENSETHHNGVNENANWIRRTVQLNMSHDFLFLPLLCL